MARRYGRLPSEITARGLDDWTVDCAVFTEGVNEEVRQAKRARK